MFGNLFDVQNYSTIGWILLTLGAMLLFGFLGTRITSLFRLPNVTAYIVVGVLIGPSVLNLFLLVLEDISNWQLLKKVVEKLLLLQFLKPCSRQSLLL